MGHLLDLVGQVVESDVVFPKEIDILWQHLQNCVCFPLDVQNEGVVFVLEHATSQINFSRFGYNLVIGEKVYVHIAVDPGNGVVFEEDVLVVEETLHHELFVDDVKPYDFVDV